MKPNEKKAHKEEDYLSHYTTINTLGYILKNRTIRFNNLANMDDTDEALYNFKKYGKYCFVSCWTDIVGETIPLWKMYSDEMKGVRIKLRKNPFLKHTYNEVYKNLTGTTMGYIPEANVATDDYTIIMREPFLFNVTYINKTDFDEMRKDDLFVKKDDLTFSFQNNKIGKYKSDYWKFQKELRYMFQAIPLNLFSKEKSDYDFQVNELLKLKDLPFSYFDIEIDSDSFAEMEILMGPKTNDIDKEIVELFVKKYNPTAKIQLSKLKNSIR